MKLTRAADYAIRILTHLASNNVESTSSDLAVKLDIPFNHIAKLVQMLSRNGFLLTRKGKGGGLKLAVNPKNINLYDVIEIIEGPMVLSDCILNLESCKFGKKCKVRRHLVKVRGKMQEMFSSATIFDLASSN